MLKLTWRNTIRHPLRAALTILGMAVAVLAFCLLRTVVAAWYSGVDASSPVRLVTRNAVSLMFPLPLSYLAKIQAVPGIVRVAYAYWFEGIYIDKRHFFPQFAALLPGYLDAYPEYLMPEDQKVALVRDRRGALAGRKLAARFGWRVGDAIVLTGTYFPGEYRLVLRAIYKGRDPSTDETQLFFHWDYLNETMKKVAPEMAD
jgi:putative ABC transport system permease protein